jgi:glycosyltransferase involved in cell wall biosynthesis
MSDSVKKTNGITPTIKVSVIIPVYKVEQYLIQCLDSVLTQTLEDIEIICVNDCSPDNSAVILQRCKDKDDRIRVIQHPSNMGLSGARNSGIDAARGEFIYFLDSDDFLACHDAIEVLYQTAIDDDADEVVGGLVKWYEKENTTNLDWHERYLKKEVHSKPLSELPQLVANVVACNKLIRRSLLNENDLRFNEQIRKHEDNPFSIQVHILANAISIVPKTTYVYRQSESGSIMTRVQKSDCVNRTLYCHDIFEFIESDKKNKAFRGLYYPMYARQLIGSAEILSRFSPSETECISLLKSWIGSIELFDRGFPEILPEQREVFELILEEDFMSAWVQAIEISPSNDKRATTIRPNDLKSVPPGNSINVATNTTQSKIAHLKIVNEKLESQIAMIKTSLSWRLTFPLRFVIDKLVGPFGK